MRIFGIFIITLFIVASSTAQTIPESRSTNWTIAGLRDTGTAGFVEINMEDLGAVGDSVTPNDSILAATISSISGNGAILKFPNGKFLFEKTISLASNIIIKGQGAEETAFIMNLTGTGNAFELYGSLLFDTSALSSDGLFDSTFIHVFNASAFSPGDWIHIIQNDSDLITSSWALRSVGQICRIENVSGNRIELSSPLRMQFNTDKNPYIRNIDPIENSGIECIKIERLDNTLPQLTSNVRFNYAVNCWISGIESYRCNYSHIDVARSSNIYISRSYIHHAFNYGSGGRAYGVMLESSANECLVENNIFHRLRHSMILQSGANGNVFTFNYSHDPFWSLIPNDAAGDIVLHGNYPFMNLFEQNICQNIVIDNSHGPNGPFNTLFRNRAESYGIFFSASNSPNQNILGNEITNTDAPYNLVNYTIQGSSHLLHGNNNKGTIHPPGTETLPDISYAYTNKPEFVSADQWAAIGTPNPLANATIPALERYESNEIFEGMCGDIPSSVNPVHGIADNLIVYPNPFKDQVSINSTKTISFTEVFNTYGQLVFSSGENGKSIHLNTDRWPQGTYVVKVHFEDTSGSKTLETLMVKLF